jgi:hypothetical protein
VFIFFIVPAFYNPLYFDLKLQVVSPDGKIHSKEESHAFVQKDKRMAFAFSDFWNADDLKNQNFQWNKDEVHFIFGFRFVFKDKIKNKNNFFFFFRFPTWKREADALLACSN